MAEAIRTTSKEDFDPQTLVAPIDEHTKDISNLTSRIKIIEDKFGTHTQIANTLLETSKEAMKMNEMLQESFIGLLEKNDRVRHEIKNLIELTSKDKVKSLFINFGGKTFTVLIFILGVISSEFIKFIFKAFLPLK